MPGASSCDIGKVVSAVRRLQLTSLGSLASCECPEMGLSRVVSPVIATLLTNMSNPLPLLFLVSGHLSAQSFELVS